MANKKLKSQCVATFLFASATKRKVCKRKTLMPEGRDICYIDFKNSPNLFLLITTLNSLAIKTSSLSF
jgi:hypothetical protein